MRAASSTVPALLDTIKGIGGTLSSGGRYTGVTLKTRLVIPADEEDVVDKLQLAGTFELAEARFTPTSTSRRR